MGLDPGACLAEAGALTRAEELPEAFEQALRVWTACVLLDAQQRVRREGELAVGGEVEGQAGARAGQGLQPLAPERTASIE